jgi:hypothetical protein
MERTHRTEVVARAYERLYLIWSWDVSVYSRFPPRRFSSRAGPAPALARVAAQRKCRTASAAWRARRKSGRSVLMRRKRKEPSRSNVVDLGVKRGEKLTNEIIALVQQTTNLLDEQVRLIVTLYQQWEHDNPALALRASDKMAMVRLGFVGPGGFDRCDEADRSPMSAFISEDGDLSDEILDDRKASELLMCPAMESRVCQGVWRGMRMPPCYLLLLEVHRGLGGGCHDSGVQEAVEDFDRWPGPEQYAERFVHAEQLLRRHRR